MIGDLLRMLFHFERRHEPMTSAGAFAMRLSRNLLAAGLFIGISLAIGVLGYRLAEGMSWLDAFANAAMILSGMGPLAPLATPEGKIFAGCYALWSGLALVFTSGILLAPIVHRVLHALHIEEGSSGQDG